MGLSPISVTKSLLNLAKIPLSSYFHPILFNVSVFKILWKDCYNFLCLSFERVDNRLWGLQSEQPKEYSPPEWCWVLGRPLLQRSNLLLWADADIQASGLGNAWHVCLWLGNGVGEGMSLCLANPSFSPSLTGSVWQRFGFVLFCFIETGSHYVTLAGKDQTGLKLREFCMPLFPKCWNLKACPTTPGFWQGFKIFLFQLSVSVGFFIKAWYLICLSLLLW